MSPDPVHRFRRPAFPTRDQVRDDPDLLLRHLPPGWKLSREFAAATSLFLAAGMAACAPPSGKSGEPPSPGVALVAPLFEHGEGRGYTGCVVTTPPVFLSEEEALQVIREEMASHGVDFSEQDVTLEGVDFMQRSKTFYFDHNGDWFEGDEVTGPGGPFVADGRAPDQGISIEFISKDDYYLENGPFYASTVQGYNLKAVAEDLRERMAAGGKGGAYFGTFYDPIESHGVYDEEKEEYTSPTGASMKALKEQVKGFVDWLKAQGAI